MKLDSQNNTKFSNHVIKRAHEINTEKQYMIRLKWEIIWTGGLPPVPFFCILLNGDVYNEKIFCNKFKHIGSII